MATGDIASSGFDLPGVPWVLYITEGGISFHGTYWHNDYGRPRSHGCINLTPQAAKWLFRWTTPSVPHDKELIYGYVGTKVEIKV
jgi:lipoprotein-anchoring transpeptidase ErfK/SrfK